MFFPWIINIFTHQNAHIPFLFTEEKKTETRASIKKLQKSQKSGKHQESKFFFTMQHIVQQSAVADCQVHSKKNEAEYEKKRRKILLTAQNWQRNKKFISHLFSQTVFCTF